MSFMADERLRRKSEASEAGKPSGEQGQLGHFVQQDSTQSFTASGYRPRQGRLEGLDIECIIQENRASWPILPSKCRVDPTRNEMQLPGALAERNDTPLYSDSTCPRPLRVQVSPSKVSPSKLSRRKA